MNYRKSCGFTLIELMAAMLILALLALMSHRGLATVLDTRDHARLETEKWQRVSAFLDRFERDIMLAAPRPVRTADGLAPPWRSQPASLADNRPQIEFSRFASTDNMDIARRLAYHLNSKGEIELWIWPALDVSPDSTPGRYAVLSNVTRFEVNYMGATLNWEDQWPVAGIAAEIPKAVRLRLVLASGEEIIRIYALYS
jgi:general secretion pathway protein J